MDATYRTNLERLNETNFARFDGKLEQRFAEMDARWDRRVSELVVSIAKLRTDLVLWMLAFWTGTMLALSGFLFVVLRSRG